MLSILVSLAWSNPDYDQGLRALRTKNYRKAEILLSSCIQDEPDNSACHWELGWVYWVQKDWKKVVQEWERVEELNPDKKDLKKYLSKAQQEYRHTQQYKKMRGQRDYLQGIRHMEKRQYKKAVQSFSRCIQRDEKNSECYWEKGWAHYTLSAWKEAAQMWKQVKVLDPQREDLDIAEKKIRIAELKISQQEYSCDYSAPVNSCRSCTSDAQCGGIEGSCTLLGEECSVLDMGNRLDLEEEGTVRSIVDFGLAQVNGGGGMDIYLIEDRIYAESTYGDPRLGRFILAQGCTGKPRESFSEFDCIEKKCRKKLCTKLQKIDAWIQDSCQKTTGAVLCDPKLDLGSYDYIIPFEFVPNHDFKNMLKDVYNAFTIQLPKIGTKIRDLGDCSRAGCTEEFLMAYDNKVSFLQKDYMIVQERIVAAECSGPFYCKHKECPASTEEEQAVLEQELEEYINTKCVRILDVTPDSFDEAHPPKIPTESIVPKPKWSITPSSFEELQQSFAISSREGDYFTIISIGETELEYERFEFTKYHNNKEKIYLITGQGTGTPNISLFYYLISEEGALLLSFQSIRPLQVLPEEDLAFSLGYSEGVETIVTYRNKIAKKTSHKPGLTIIPMSLNQCQSMYQITHEQCPEPMVAAECSEIDGEYSISMEYADDYYEASSSSTFQYDKQPKYCLQLCKKEKKMSFAEYKKEICGI